MPKCGNNLQKDLALAPWRWRVLLFTSLLFVCCWLLLSQSVHYAFMNDKWSSWFSVNRIWNGTFKHGEYWVARSVLSEDFCSSRWGQQSHIFNAWESAAEPVWVHSTEFQNWKMIGHEHDLTTKRRDHVVIWCNVYVLDACEPSGPAVSKLAIWPLLLYCLMEYIWSEGVERCGACGLLFLQFCISHSPCLTLCQKLI